MTIKNTFSATTSKDVNTLRRAVANSLNHVTGRINEELDGKASLDGADFTGDVTVQTPTEDTQAANKAYVDANGGGGDITIQDEGSDLTNAGTTLNFVGAGVVASGDSAVKTITISGTEAPVDSEITDGSSNAVENNAVFDALALKANSSQVLTDVPLNAVFTDTNTQLNDAQVVAAAETNANIKLLTGATNPVFTDTDTNTQLSNSEVVTAAQTNSNINALVNASNPVFTDTNTQLNDAQVIASANTNDNINALTSFSGTPVFTDTDTNTQLSDSEVVTAAETNANIALLTAATNPVFTDTDTNTQLSNSEVVTAAQTNANINALVNASNPVFTDTDTNTQLSNSEVVTAANTNTNINALTSFSGTPVFTDTDTNTQLTDEQVQDIVGGMVDGTQTGINVTYDDTNGNLNFVATGSSAATQTQAVWNAGLVTVESTITPVKLAGAISDQTTSITPVQAQAIIDNSAKTGITATQTANIVTNNAKTGITSAQATAITANTAKTGITTAQANAITANTTKLNGIENNATADQTGSEIVTAINGSSSLVDDNNIASTITRNTELFGYVNQFPDTFTNTFTLVANTYYTYEGQMYKHIGPTEVIDNANDFDFQFPNSGGNQWEHVAGVTVDTTITNGSTNPVDGDAIFDALAGKANTSHTHTASQVTDFDTEVSNNTSVAANTAKTGITSTQAANIVTNNAKTGITSAQANAITANTAKTGISSDQAAAITANTAKVGITSTQAANIVTNNAKTGITSAQAANIVTNNAKTGITSAQATAITANTTKLAGIESSATADQTGSEIVTAINGSSSLVDDNNIASTITRDTELFGYVNQFPDTFTNTFTLVNGTYYTYEGQMYKHIGGTEVIDNANDFDFQFPNSGGNQWEHVAGVTVDTTITNGSTNPVDGDAIFDALAGKANTSHTHTASQITDFDTEVSNNTSVAANTAKTGITTAQANAITANTNKTGITSTQAANIVTNNAKTGITSTQAANIVTNNAKTGITSTQAANIVTNNGKTTNATHTGEVTGSGALTIANDVVSNAKLTNMATNTIKGRINSSGNPEDLTAVQTRNLLNVEDGATADQTNAEIVTAARTNTNINALVNASNPVFTDTDTNTTYTAGDNVTINGTVISAVGDNTLVIADDDDFFPNPVSTLAFSGAGATVEESGNAAVTVTIPGVTVDTSLTNGSSNPVTNNAVFDGLAGKANTSHTHTASQVTDFDTEVSNNTSVAANTAKTGITSAQATAITNNTAKVSNATHTGEVTGSGALVIANDVVSNAKLTNMATNTIKGRINSSGNPEDLSAVQVRSLINVEDGATADQTNAEIVTAARTNTNINALANASNPVFTDTTYSAGFGLTIFDNTFNLDTVSVSNGGTGSGSASGARTNLGAAALAGSSSQDFSTADLDTDQLTVSDSGAGRILLYDTDASNSSTTSNYQIDGYHFSSGTNEVHQMDISFDDDREVAVRCQFLVDNTDTATSRIFYPGTDGLVRLGVSSSRWNAVFASTGTIQTSDENEKQQVSSLSVTEMNVAKAISKLFIKFKWNDSVALKGDDDARLHSGVIAQNVAAAFTAEGLEAFDYGLVGRDNINVDENDIVIEDEDPVWRYNVRYSELLCFLAAYNEQRFTAIEARLDALEA